VGRGRAHGARLHPRRAPGDGRGARSARGLRLHVGPADAHRHDDGRSPARRRGGGPGSVRRSPAGHARRRRTRALLPGRRTLDAGGPGARRGDDRRRARPPLIGRALPAPGGWPPAVTLIHTGSFLVSETHPILIVDDDGELRDVLLVLCELRGRRALAVPTAEEALARLRDGLRPSLIVFDLVM